MKILAIDIGIKYGWCYKNETDEESGHDTAHDLLEWGKQIKTLLTTWNPEMLVLSQTNSFGFWSAARSALMKAGIAFYICGKMDIPGVELNDTSARKAVFGKALKKNEVQLKFPNIQSDELDAQILARGWYLLNIETK